MLKHCVNWTHSVRCSAKRCGWLCAQGTPPGCGMLQTLTLKSVCWFLCTPRCAALYCLPRGFCSFFLSFFHDKETLYYWKKIWRTTGVKTLTQMPPRSPIYVSGQFPFHLLHVPVFYTHSNIQCSKFYILCKCLCFVNWDPKCAWRWLAVGLRSSLPLTSQAWYLTWRVFSFLMVSICPTCGINTSSERFLGYRSLHTPTTLFTLSWHLWWGGYFSHIGSELFILLTRFM